MEEYRVDLHLHSKCSDGEQTPEQVIAEARKTGMSCIALTDHNYFAIREPMILEDIEVIPGAEFSMTYRYDEGRGKEVHVLGLFFNGVDQEIERIWDCIVKDAWIEAILLKLNELGCRMTIQELEEENPESKRLNRTQVAKLLVKKGYATDRDDAMDRLIGNRSPHYINPVDYVDYISLEDGVREILRCGGFPILAHPFHYGFDAGQVENLVKSFRSITDKPLGIEVYYSKYNDDEVRWLERLADRYGLIPSVGSDRHKATQEFARGSKEILERIKAAVNH